MKDPKVTVLMPVYNGEAYLKETIESILNQTFVDFEFLIINDGSTDNSRKIVLSFSDSRIRLVDNPENFGLTKSLNHGLNIARGELIARQDADDISHPERLKKQIQFMDSHPKVVLLGTSAQGIDERGNPTKSKWRAPESHLAICWYLMFLNAFAHSSVIFRRDIIRENLGGYYEEFLLFEDFELWSRVAQSFPVENLPEPLIDYRHHYGSITTLVPPPIRHIERLIQKNLCAFLKLPSVPFEWAHYITLFFYRFQCKDEFSRFSDWGQMLEMYKGIWTRYKQLYPDAKSDRTIRSHLANVLYLVAYYSAPRSRMVSYRAYLNARKLGPKSKSSPSFIKYLALWGLGEKTRHFYHYLNQWSGN